MVDGRPPAGRARWGILGRVDDETCRLCRVEDADAFFHRTRVWEDELWRLSVVGQGAILGFGHLEPKRHIPFITDLDGDEAATLGPVLARVTLAMRQATGADAVYVYVFGERVPHLHFNLAPHRAGDALVGGAGVLTGDAVPLDAADHWSAAHTIRGLLEDT
jgi:diadenosine tetraphosphate (Ap4A) HIT family hydrolase